MRLRTFLFILLALLGAASHLKAQSEFVILDVGRKVLYDVERGSGLGVRKAESVERIEGRESIDGKEYFRTVTAYSGIPGMEPDVCFRRLAADGLHELRYIKGKPVEQLFLPLPLEVGKRWTFRFGDVESACIVEAREPAILPAKTYDDAYRVSCAGKIKRRSFKTYGYYVAGIGLVRVVQDSGNGTVLEMRLREIGKLDV